MTREAILPRMVSALIRFGRISRIRELCKRLTFGRGFTRSQFVAAAILAVAVAVMASAIAGGYHIGPYVTVQDVEALPRLPEPVLPEKPSGSTTVPGESQVPGDVSGGAQENQVGEVNGSASAQTAPSSLSRLVQPVEGQVIRSFGYSYSTAFKDYRFHTGIDLAAREGTPVVAAAKGRVQEITFDADHRWQVVLDHGDGWQTAYEELGKVADLSVGTEVEGGAALGYLGQPGKAADSQEAHLHFEVRFNGEPHDPSDLLQ